MCILRLFIPFVRLDLPGKPFLQCRVANIACAHRSEASKGSSDELLTNALSQSDVVQGRRLLVIATSSLGPHLVDLGLMEIFDAQIKVPPVSNLEQLQEILRAVDFYDGSVQHTIRSLPYPRDAIEAETTNMPLLIGIKKLLSIIEMARQEPEDAAIRLVQGLASING